MATERIIVGAIDDDELSARRVARQLRDQGHEVVFVGARQSAEMLVRAAVAEDATRIVADLDQQTRAVVARLCAEAGVDDIAVGPVRVT